MNGSSMINSSPGPLEANFQRDAIAWFSGCLMCICVAGDLFIIYIIKKTPTLQSYTGTLLISQTLSDVGIQMVSLLMIAPDLLVENCPLGDAWQYVLGLIARAFHAITCQTLAAICLNLYFAICHSKKYLHMMSSRYVTIFVPGCWIFNIFLCMTPLMSEETRRSLYTSDKLNYLPVYERSTLWAWIIIVSDAYVIPAFITTFAFVSIRKYTGKIQTITHANLHYVDKYKLSQIIAGISACYIGIWSLMHLSRALQAKYEAGENGIFRKIFLIAFFTNMAYDTFKLPIYMWIYKPIRVSTMQLFRRTLVTPVQAIVVRELNEAI